MKISDFDIYHLPPLMGSFVDFIEDKCRKLLEESPQFTELMREDHELLDKYWFLNTITDTNGVTNALNLSYEETKALQRFCTVEEDINCWQRLQMYLLGMEHAMELLELLKIGRTCKGDKIMLSSYKQTGNKEDTEKERGDTMAENNTKELDFESLKEEEIEKYTEMFTLDREEEA